MMQALINQFGSTEDVTMGLLDQLAGQMLGGGANQGGDSLVQMVTALINNAEGGLPGVLAKLQDAGLGDQVASCLGSGSNAAVDAGQIGSAIGPDLLAQLAGQLGVSNDQVAGGLAEALPGLVDKLSPAGELSGDNDMLQQGLSMLGGLLGGR